MNAETKDKIEKALAECDALDCIKVLAMTWARLEYLQGREHLEKSGFQPN